MRTASKNELESADLISVLRRRWIVVLFPIVAMASFAFVLSVSQADQFEASARVLLGETAADEAVGSGSLGIQYRDRLLENELRTATGDAARIGVAGRFDVAVDDVPTVTVMAENGADVLIFQATDGNRNNAATIANAWAEFYLTLKIEEADTSITGAVSQLQQKLVELETERAEVRSDLVRLEEAFAGASDATQPQGQLRVDREASRISGSVTLIDAQIKATAAGITDLNLSADLAIGNGPRLITRATPPAARSNMSTTLIVLLGLIIGSLVGTTLGMLSERLDRAVRTPDDLEALGLLHLGSIPRSATHDKSESALTSLERPESPQAAAYQKVRSALEFLSVERSLASLAITSASPGEGKTTLSANLATVMAQSGRRTILVDADLRRPRVHKVFSIKQSPGLTSVVLDPAMLSESAWPIPPLAGSLVVLPAGPLPPHPASFISSPSFGTATAALSTVADVAIFDAPPILPVADSLALARHVSGTVIVVHAGRTKKCDLQRSLASLTQAGALVVGAVLIGVKQPPRSYQYRYAPGEDTERFTAAEAARSSDANVKETAALQDNMSITA